MIAQIHQTKTHEIDLPELYSLEQLLHDRATRGEKLSVEDQARLDAWLLELDRQRMQALFGQEEAPSFQEWEKKAHRLQQQIDSLFAQIALDSATLQQMVERNRILRNENDELRKQLLHLIVMEPA